MIPRREDQLIEFEPTAYPSKTYLGLSGLKALELSIDRILKTERYQHIIYSWAYGIETQDLFGMPHDFVELELKSRIEEALLQDDRILAIEDYTYHRGAVTFRVITSLGDLDMEAKYDL